MKILAVGDSFTYGYELQDINNAWPCVLARKLNATVTNLAKPGGGNTQIVRNIVEHADQFDLVVIGWTSPGRIEFSDQIGTYDIWPGWNGKHRIPHRVEIAKQLTIAHNDQYLFRQFLINVILVQSFLISKNIPCIMASTQGNSEHYYSSCKQNNIDLLNKIDYNTFIEWPENGMAEWTFGCEQGPEHHFLENGHERVAEKFYEHYRHIRGIS
jgi:hypothetical protein